MRLYACPIKSCPFLILFFLGSISSLKAQTEERISIKLQNVSLEKVFSVIESKTEYRFVYTEEQLKDSRLISLSENKESVQAILKKCFQDQPVYYSVENKYIIIHRKEEDRKIVLYDLKGRITSEKGEALEGVTVLVKGTNQGTKTSVSGEYILHDLKGNEFLLVSFIGYETQEIFLSDRKNIDIRLKLSYNSLDETVVKGYYNTTIRMNTGNVGTVKSKTIEEQPVSNPLAALEGQVAGLDITQTTGVPGGNFTVQIRGQNSIANGNNPLYIIDGVPYGSSSLSSEATAYSIVNQASPLNYINPAEIERVEILKDADATAIYGSRGANGVILITTKKGSEGTSKIDINLYSGIGTVTRMMPLLNTQQYLAMRHEAFFNDQETPDDNNAYDLTVWDTTRYTNWQKFLIGNQAHLDNAQANISGGSANTQYSLGLGYNKATTVFPGDLGEQKASAFFNITHKSFNQKFKAVFSGSFLSDNNNLIQIDLTPSALYLPPDAPPIYDSAGNLNWGTPSAPFSNPLSLLQRKYLSNANNLIGNMVLEYQLLKGLKLKANAGYTQTFLSENSTLPISAEPPYYGMTTGTSTFATNNIKTWIVEPQIEYQLHMGVQHFSALVGTTFQQSVQQGQTLYGTGYTNDGLLENIAGASDITVIESHYTQYRYDAFFGRLNYDWQSKYLVNLTGRRDGSSRFGPGKQFANFGAVGLGWIFSKEAFINQNLSFLSFGKIRGSYGITGNDQIGDYQYLSTYNATSYPYQQSAGLYPAQLSNPDYSWETNKKSELAIELGFLKDRILFSLSGYRNISSNQLVGYSLPLITGFSSVVANLPATVLNSGTEWELQTINMNGKKFTWTSSINLTIPHNKLLSYPNLAGSPYANFYVVGKSLYTKQLYHSTGVNPQTGVYTFQDVDNDGQISYPNDLTSYKQIAKSYYGGFQNNFSFKGWQLNIFFQFVKQTGFNYQSTTYLAPGMISNQPVLVLNRWQNKGDQSPVQKFTQDAGSDAYTQYINESYLGDNTIVDASFIRLKNLALSWSLPDSWKQKIHFQQAKIYLQCQNLLTITHYPGMDPENQSINYLPPLKVVTAGIQFTL